MPMSNLFSPNQLGTYLPLSSTSTRVTSLYLPHLSTYPSIHPTNNLIFFAGFPSTVFGMVASLSSCYICIALS